jgi:hypothetical protein
MDSLTGREQPDRSAINVHQPERDCIPNVS